MASLQSPKFPTGRTSTPGSGSGSGSSSAGTAKRKQQEVKTMVGMFVKLMGNWAQDVAQIEALLRNVGHAMSTLEAVQRLQNRHPKNVPLFDVMFPNACGLLVGRVHADVEAMLHQMKQHATGLGDVVVAMRMVADEAATAAANEGALALGNDGGVFTFDHLLDIQQLGAQYVLEYERKRDILRKSVFASGDSGDSSAVLEAAAAWPDDQPGSAVDGDLVETFLVMNGGGGDRVVGVSDDT